VPTHELGRLIGKVEHELGFSDTSEILKVASGENELGLLPKALEVMAEA